MSQKPCLPLAHSRKRRRQSDENNHNNNQQAADPVSFDDVATMDASEYLRRVVEQGRQLQSSTPIASITTERIAAREPPIEGSAACLHYLISSRTQIGRADSSTGIPPPTRRWVHETLETFEKLRNYVHECRCRYGIGGKEHRLVSAVPPMKDATGWLHFCGIATDKEAPSLNLITETAESTATNTSETPHWETLVPPGGHTPSVRLLCQLDQVLIRRLLGHLIAATPQQQEQRAENRWYMWMYGLLAHLETPVHRDDASRLRRVLLQLSHRRDSAACHLVMTICGLYFGQAAGYSELFGQSDDRGATAAAAEAPAAKNETS